MCLRILVITILCGFGGITLLKEGQYYEEKNNTDGEMICTLVGAALLTISVFGFLFIVAEWIIKGSSIFIN